MFNCYRVILKFLCFFILFTFLSCSGGGTLGSSSTGGVTIKGQARISSSNIPIANSPMQVLSADGKTEILRSETDKDGKFAMSLDNSDQPILIDIKNASSGFQIEKELLKNNELRLTILDKNNSVTEIEYYMGINMEARGSCSLERDPITSKLVLRLNDQTKKCLVALRATLGGSSKNQEAKVTLCGTLKFMLENEKSNELEVQPSELGCKDKILLIEFEELNVAVDILSSPEDIQ